MLQSIDHIKLFTSLNPYDFGIISYLHSQNDILSSGGSVKTISVSQALPFSEGIIEKFYMEYFMKGIKSESVKDDSVIVSGHSYQSKEPGITITMNGVFEKQISKNQGQENDLIYLSKPLGTGYLLAAYFNNSDFLSSIDFQNLIGWLKKGNIMASEISKSFKSNITTDISGFGLASHLSDICKSSKLSAEIKLNEEILINKNIKILENFKSTGFDNNYSSSVNEILISDSNKLKNILYDPQTNGPLLLSIHKKDQVEFEKKFQLELGFNPILLGEFKKSGDKLINVID
jgi:selenide,water dikinase